MATSKASFTVQWSSSEYRRSQAQSKNVISLTRAQARNGPGLPVLAGLATLPRAPLAGGGGATAPPGPTTFQLGGGPWTGATGAWDMRVARRFLRSSTGVATRLGSWAGAAWGAGPLGGAGGGGAERPGRLTVPLGFGSAIGGTEKVGGVACRGWCRGGAGGAGGWAATAGYGGGTGGWPG